MTNKALDYFRRIDETLGPVPKDRLSVTDLENRKLVKIIESLPGYFSSIELPLLAKMFELWLSNDQSKFSRPRLAKPNYVTGKEESIKPGYRVDWSWYRSFAPFAELVDTELPTVVNRFLAENLPFHTPLGLEIGADNKNKQNATFTRAYRLLETEKKVILDPGLVEYGSSAKKNVLPSLFVGSVGYGLIKSLIQTGISEKNEQLYMLGSHGIRIYLSGFLERTANKGELLLTIESVQYRLSDTFGFDCEQYLGAWNTKGLAKKFAILSFFMGYWKKRDISDQEIQRFNNRMFRDYRDITGNGTDFDIYTPLTTYQRGLSVKKTVAVKA